VHSVNDFWGLKRKNHKIPVIISPLSCNTDHSQYHTSDTSCNPNEIHYLDFSRHISFSLFLEQHNRSWKLCEINKIPIMWAAIFFSTFSFVCVRQDSFISQVNKLIMLLRLDFILYITGMFQFTNIPSKYTLNKQPLY
jgi:hypothetical protein